LIGIGLNLAFVFAETIAGFANNSMPLLTDAGHNTAGIELEVIKKLITGLPHVNHVHHVHVGP
jgi:Co/Zn/Cd efflux system component